MAGHFNGLLAAACAAAVLVSDCRMASAQETPAQILAAQLRRQGHRCDAPVTAQRDSQLSKPDEAAWILKCVNASYRMRLIPDMAARIEQLE
jgi:hypothetical protein